MNWGKWIVVAFLSFAAFIAVLVVVCFKEDVSLVSSRYYEDDLRYQQQYDQETLAAALQIKPDISINKSGVVVVYPNFGNIEYGTLTIMRPANATLDHKFELLQQRDSIQQFAVTNFVSGLYKVSMQWKENGKAYRLDKSLVL